MDTLVSFFNGLSTFDKYAVVVSLWQSKCSPEDQMLRVDNALGYLAGLSWSHSSQPSIIVGRKRS